MRRQAIIASVSKRPEHGCVPDEARDKFLQDTERLLRRAAAMGADLVAFPEVYPQLRTPDMYAAAEPHDAGTLTWAQEQARRFRTHIVWPRFERRPDGLRNTAILIDRKGRLPGQMIGKSPWLQSVFVDTDAVIGDFVDVSIIHALPNSLGGTLRPAQAAA